MELPPKMEEKKGLKPIEFCFVQVAKWVGAYPYTKKVAGVNSQLRHISRLLVPSCSPGKYRRHT